MEHNKLEGIIEAVLFALGDPVPLSKIAEIAVVDEITVKDTIDKLSERYLSEKRGIVILQLEDKYQLATNILYADYITKTTTARIRKPLSPSALECLAIIAYRQPVTKQIIEEIRGVNCDYPVNRLIEIGLVEEQGRLDIPGKPFLYVTTDEFLKCFGISTLSDLPKLEEGEKC